MEFLLCFDTIREGFQSFLEDFEWLQHHGFRKKNVNFNYFYWFVLHILRPVDILTEICMGFVATKGMGYWV